MLFNPSLFCLIAGEIGEIRSHRYILPGHDRIGNQPQLRFLFTPEPGRAWMKSGSHTAARLETLTDIFLDKHEYHIAVTNPPVSMLLFTLLPIGALPCANGSVILKRPCLGVLTFLQTHTFPPFLNDVYYSQPDGYNSPFAFY